MPPKCVSSFFQKLNIRKTEMEKYVDLIEANKLYLLLRIDTFIFGELELMYLKDSNFMTGYFINICYKSCNYRIP